MDSLATVLFYGILASAFFGIAALMLGIHEWYVRSTTYQPVMRNIFMRDFK